MDRALSLSSPVFRTGRAGWPVAISGLARWLCERSHAGRTFFVPVDVPTGRGSHVVRIPR